MGDIVIVIGLYYLFSMLVHIGILKLIKGKNLSIRSLVSIHKPIKIDTEVHNQNCILKIVYIIKNIVRVILDYLLPDKLFSYNCKLLVNKMENLKEHKEYVTTMNIINLSISIIFALISVLSMNKVFKQIVILFFIIRAISRSYEIIIAFVNDVVENTDSIYLGSYLLEVC